MILQELLQLTEGKLRPAVVKLAKAYVAAEAANPGSDEANGLFDDFVFQYSQLQNSAMEVWMSKADKERLVRLIADGKDVRNVSGDPEKIGYKGKVEQLMRQGYQLLADEDNYDSAESIFYK